MPQSTARRLLSPFLSYQLRRSMKRLGVSVRFDWRPADEPSEVQQDVAIHRSDGRIQLEHFPIILHRNLRQRSSLRIPGVSMSG
jgi:hypothetical protein